MKNHILIILFFTQFAITIPGCNTDVFDKPDYNYNAATTQLSRTIVDGSKSYIGHVKSVSEVRLTQGVTLLRMGYLNQKGLAMQLFLYKVSLGNISIRVTLPNDEPTLGKLQTLVAQATAIENKSVFTVWGAINGSVFSANGQPSGILHRNGTALRDQMGSAPAFFAILNDGSAVCLPASGYDAVKSRIREAISGDARLVADGYLLVQSDISIPARSAVGVSQDGGEVFLLVVDGNDFYYSNGITRDDLALLMKSCGAYNAISLSSGAPVTAIWRNERLITLFELLNKPANKGVAAEISNGLAIVER